MTEAHLATTRRVARPLSLGGLFGLFLVLVIGLSPAVAATGAGRNRAERDAAGGRRTSTRQGTPSGVASADVVTSALPVEGPRQVTLGLARLFTTQFDGSPYANGNCNMAAGAMLFEVQTGRLVTGAQMRRWSRARTSGTTLMDLRRAFQAQGQWVQIAEDMSWDAFNAEVRSGRSAVVQGWYGNLRDNVLQAGFTTAHSVFVLGFSRHAKGGHGAFYVMDPLGSGGYDGAWWTKAELRRFGWSGRPHTVGTGRTAYYGNVALQSVPSHKRLSSKAYRPQFQSYWDTGKSLIRRAKKVNVVERRPGQSPFLLKVDDPHLKLSPSKARRNNLAKPVRNWKSDVTGFRINDKRLIVRTKPLTKITAAAPGRVVFRGWSLDGTRYLWVQHGPSLFTIYKNLDTVRVEPGEWVRKGTTLGKVKVTTVKKKSGKVLKYGTFRFIVSVGNPRSPSSRQFPLPFLGGSNGTLR